ncbi:MAG: hypothetical protein ACE5NG_15395, partial [bacterium]
ILEQSWPEYDPKALKRDEREIVIQINGRLRDQIVVPTELSTDKAELEKRALEQIKERIEGKEVRKVIVVPGKLVNVVV